MDLHLLNPAGRLFLFLDHSWNANEAEPIRGVWSRYLQASEPHDLYRGMTRILELPMQVVEAVELLQDPVIPQDELLEPLPMARAALEFIGGLDQPIARLKQQYDSGTIAGLKSCSRVLGRAQVRIEVREDSLHQIRNAASELLTLINDDPDLDFALRRTMQDHCLALLRSLDLFNATGLEGVIGEADRLRGHMSRAAGDFGPLRQKPDLWQGFQKLCIALAVVAGAVHAPVSIAADVGALLELVQSEDDQIFVSPSDTSEANTTERNSDEPTSEVP